MDKAELIRRCKQLTLRCWNLCGALPKNGPGRNVESQLSRSASSVTANYRAACRARSHAEWIAKLGQVLEECDETLLWLELIDEAGLIPQTKTAALKTEAEELVKIFATALKTSRAK